MSISFRPPAAPPPPVEEQTHWRVSKRDRKGNIRIAEGRVRRLPGIGLELRVLIGGELAFSKLCRTDDDPRLLGHLSERCREDFERLGWTRESARPPDA